MGFDRCAIAKEIAEDIEKKCVRDTVKCEILKEIRTTILRSECKYYTETEETGVDETGFTTRLYHKDKEIGYTEYYLVENNTIMLIWYVYINPEYIGKKLSELLLDKVESKTKELKISMIKLRPDIGLEDFWLHQGFGFIDKTSRTMVKKTDLD